MQLRCSDVCEYVHEELVRNGFDIDPNDEDHEDIIEALEGAVIVDSEAVRIVKSYMEKVHRVNLEVLDKDFPLNGIEGADTVRDVGEALKKL